MTRLSIALLIAPLILACGVTAITPTSDGVRELSFTPTRSDTFSPTAENVPDAEIGVVIVDILTVRVCPSQSCQVARKDGEEWYLRRGEAVMGGCYRFVDEVWLGFDFVDGEPTRFAAVLYDGQWLMEGVCQ